MTEGVPAILEFLRTVCGYSCLFFLLYIMTLKKLIICVSVLPAHVSVHHLRPWFQLKLEEVGSPGTGDMDGVSHWVGARNLMGSFADCELNLWTLS